MNIESIFTILAPYCSAIYYGGSRVDPIINNPHDYDYICFAKQHHRYGLVQCLRKHKLRAALSTKLRQLTPPTPEESTETNLIDFSQIRVFPYTQITWFSYLDSLMIKVTGEDICPKTDIINEHRVEFLKCLREKADLLLAGTMRNQKRWYHILRGIYILMNNSYDVTDQQRQEINMLHDLSDGWESIRDKTAKLLETLLLTEGLTQ